MLLIKPLPHCSLYTISVILYMYLFTWRGRYPPQCQILITTRSFITSIISCKFHKNLFNLWFYMDFIMILYMYIVGGGGKIPSLGQFQSTHRRLLFPWSFAISFRKTALNSYFIKIFFHDFIYTGVDNSHGVNFEYQRRLASLWSFAVSFRKLHRALNLYAFNFKILYTYVALGQRQIIPGGKISRLIQCVCYYDKFCEVSSWYFK